MNSISRKNQVKTEKFLEVRLKHKDIEINLFLSIKSYITRNCCTDLRCFVILSCKLILTNIFLKCKRNLFVKTYLKTIILFKVHLF